MNKTLLKGRITRDIEVRYTSESNTAIAKFGLAVNRTFTKKGEEKQADFINCIAFGKTAEFINNYFSKGKEILIEGRIQTGSYDNQEGKKVYTTDVIVEQCEFCGSKGSTEKNTEDTESSFFPVESDDELPF